MEDTIIKPFHIMGILNVTPDSFSDGGRFMDAALAVEHAQTLIEEGADIIDVGGESTRPGATPVSDEEEADRVLPIVETLAKSSACRISVDTRKPQIAKAAIAAGAHMWNDVSALTFDERSVQTAKDLDCEIVLMHAQGSPQNMQDEPRYADPVAEIKAYLAARIEVCVAAGIERDKIIIDPGVGFGKTLDHNLAILEGIHSFAGLGVPVLLGASRKRFIAAIDGDAEVDERLGGSLAAVLEGFRRGASIFRVHDVAETRQALKVAAAILDGSLKR